MSKIRVDNITDEEGTGSPNIIYNNAASGRLTATSVQGAIDEVSEQAVNKQELLAGVSEAADIDEAVSFIGRGAIVESGSNSNGHYVRWENGEQLCRITEADGFVFPGHSSTDNVSGLGRTSLGAGEPIDWSYPAEFISPPSVTADSLFFTAWAACRSVTASSVLIYSFSARGNNQSTCTATAWGFWK